MEYTLYLRNQLRVYLPIELETIYDAMLFREYIPVAPAEGTGIAELAYTEYSATGVAKIIADYATDFPTVEAYGAEHTVKVKNVGAAYRFSLFEIEAAQRAGVDLNMRKQSYVRRAIETKVNQIAWLGDSDYGIGGFVNASGITGVTLGNNAAGTSKLWNDKSADEITKDVNDLIAGVTETTSGKEMPNTVILPLACYNKLTMTWANNDKTKTILACLKEIHPYITKWGWVPELATAGLKADGTTKGPRMLAYSNDPSKLQYHITVPFRLHEPEQRGLGYIVPATASVAGVTVYYPQSIAYADGM